MRVAVRVRIDMYNWTTDGPTFSSPTMPGRVLSGVTLKGKQVPKVLTSMQRPNVNNPGHRAFFTFYMGKRREIPSTVVPTSHGSGFTANRWDTNVRASFSDTDLVIYWAEKVLKPGEKRELIYAYGTGVATNPEDEGQVTVVPSGSFQPGKRFSITAYVDAPIEGQSLTLNLPGGMQLVGGEATQPVPLGNDDNRSVVVCARSRTARRGISHSRRIQPRRQQNPDRIHKVGKIDQNFVKIQNWHYL